jgi:hypothetical protein
MTLTIRTTRIDQYDNEICADTFREYYTDNGQEMIHDIDNIGEYWLDNEEVYHKENGPAVIWKKPRGMEYFKHGKYHRLDGPAVDLKFTKMWYIDGERIRCKDNEEFLRIVKMRSLL